MSMSRLSLHSCRLADNEQDIGRSKLRRQSPCNQGFRSCTSSPSLVRSPCKDLDMFHSNRPAFRCYLGRTRNSIRLNTDHSVLPQSTQGCNPGRFLFLQRLARRSIRECCYTFDTTHLRFPLLHHPDTSWGSQSSTLDCRCISGIPACTGSWQPHQRGMRRGRARSTCRRPCTSRTVAGILLELLPPCTRPRTSPRSTISSPPASSPFEGWFEI